MFLRELFKEKINQPVPLCFSSKGNLELQTRAYPLLCILQLLYSFYWCSSKSLAQAHYLDLH